MGTASSTCISIYKGAKTFQRVEALEEIL